jgi:hypothetical protein
MVIKLVNPFETKVNCKGRNAEHLPICPDPVFATTGYAPTLSGKILPGQACKEGFQTLAKALLPKRAKNSVQQGE